MRVFCFYSIGENMLSEQQNIVSSNKVHYRWPKK